MKTKEERISRILARGEVHGHAHIVTGDCTITKDNNGATLIKAGKNCAIKHLIESSFVETGVEKWTEEHHDIPLQEGSEYKYIQQQEFNPYEQTINSVKD